MPLNDNTSIASSYLDLPDAAYTRLLPTPLPEPYLVAASKSAAHLIGLSKSEFNNQELIDVFTGNELLEGSTPYAAVYSGHQFGVWAGQLGDGRAINIADIKHNEQLWELQLKGSGLTPYSRMGDGRAVLRSSIREFLCSEAMAGIGIPTTRALCITGSHFPVYREVTETASVVTRMSPTYIRFGSFEHWMAKKDVDSLKRLADYTIEQFFPEAKTFENPYLKMLETVVDLTASMIAQWQGVGFMHGVMNTDNMSILGLTIDYGPFGFMDAFDPNHVCNHSDHQGRYTYANQPKIGHWNCRALAQAILPLLGDVEEAQEVINSYPEKFTHHYMKLMRAKLGFENIIEGDEDIINELFEVLAKSKVDFTRFFRTLSTFSTQEENANSTIRDQFIDRDAFDVWALKYKTRLLEENSIDIERSVEMNKVNPKYVFRNYLAQTAIEKAQVGDFSEVETLLTILNNPFDEQPEHEAYASLPPDWAERISVSCSS